MGLGNKVVVLVSKYRNLLPYVVAQAKLESANFTSKVYKADNNMFGMKFVGREGTTRGLQAPEFDNGNPTYYAHYVNDAASLRDLLVWFELKKFPVQVAGTKEYSEELRKRGYFGTTETARAVYQKNLDYWINKA